MRVAMEKLLVPSEPTPRGWATQSKHRIPLRQRQTLRRLALQHLPIRDHRVALEVDADVVLVDTAGRLHTKADLMDELGKVKRVIERRVPVSEVLLVLDATTGQNGLAQAKVFAHI